MRRAGISVPRGGCNCYNPAMPFAAKSRAAYVSKGHRQVEGWCSPLAMHLTLGVDEMQQAEGISGSVAEIGVHHGKLFILLMLCARHGERALAMDLFDQQEHNVDASGLGDEAVFLANVRQHVGDTTPPVVLKGDTTHLDGQQVRSTIGASCRLFSVDGGHTADMTAHDLNTAAAALTDGGVVILDDYFNSAWPAVSEGACRFMAQADGQALTPFAVGGNKVFLTTASQWADRYRKALLARGFPTRHKISRMFDTEIISVSDTRPHILNRLAALPAWRRFRETPIGRLVRTLAPKHLTNRT